MSIHYGLCIIWNLDKHIKICDCNLKIQLKGCEYFLQKHTFPEGVISNGLKPDKDTSLTADE